MQTVSPHELADQWVTTECRVICTGHGHLAGHLRMMHLFQGALGRVLVASASDAALRGAPCSFDPPCAYDVFHNAQGKLTAGLETPKPHVLVSDNFDGDLSIALRLFGHAEAWAGPFQAAMVAAARRGLEWGKQDLVLDVIHAQQQALNCPALPNPVGPFQIETLTPIFRRGADQINLAPLITTLANRLRGLARWHGLDLVLDPRQLKSDALSLAALAQIQGRSGAQQRGPSRPRQGFTGVIRLPAPPAELAQLLRLAPICHIGADSTIGAGRVSLHIEPPL